MCRSQNTFWRCRHLAFGKIDLCATYHATLGRQCDGYTSFARVINAVCPSCRHTTDRSLRTHLHAEIDTEQATAGADEIDWQRGSESDKQKETRRRRLHTWAPSRQSESSRIPVIDNHLEEEPILGAQEEATLGAIPSDSASEHMPPDPRTGSMPDQSETSKLQDHIE